MGGRRRGHVVDRARSRVTMWEGSQSAVASALLISSSGVHRHVLGLHSTVDCEVLLSWLGILVTLAMVDGEENHASSASGGGAVMQLRAGQQKQARMARFRGAGACHAWHGVSASHCMALETDPVLAAHRTSTRWLGTRDGHHHLGGLTRASAGNASLANTESAHHPERVSCRRILPHFWAPSSSALSRWWAHAASHLEDAPCRRRSNRSGPEVLSPKPSRFIRSGTNPTLSLGTWGGKEKAGSCETSLALRPVLRCDDGCVRAGVPLSRNAATTPWLALRFPVWRCRVPFVGTGGEGGWDKVRRDQGNKVLCRYFALHEEITRRGPWVCCSGRVGGGRG